MQSFLKNDSFIGKSTKENVRYIIKFEKKCKKNVQPCKVKIEKIMWTQKSLEKY